MASSSQANASIAEVTSTFSMNATNSSTDQPLVGLTPTETISADTYSGGVSTSQLVGVIAALIVAVLAMLVLIHSRRHRNASKLSTPTNCSAFQGVTSLTPSYDLSHNLKASTPSTGTNTPQPSLGQTFKSSRLSVVEDVELHVAQDEPVSEILPTRRSIQPFRGTSLGSIRSLFSASFLNRGGLRSSLPAFAAFRSSLASRGGKVSTENELHAMTSSRSNQIWYSRRVSLSTPIEHQNADGGVWRDFSDTSWSIGLNSDSETESEWFTGPAGTNTYGGSFVLNRNHLSTLADKITDVEEEDINFDLCSLDDSSRHQDRTSMSEFSPRSEQSTSTFDDSSPRQIRGLSALDSRWKANSIAETVTKQSGFPFFSNESDYNNASSLISFESGFESDSDESLQEEEL